MSDWIVVGGLPAAMPKTLRATSRKWGADVKHGEWDIMSRQRLTEGRRPGRP